MFLEDIEKILWKFIMTEPFAFISAGKKKKKFKSYHWKDRKVLLQYQIHGLRMFYLAGSSTNICFVALTVLLMIVFWFV